MNHQAHVQQAIGNSRLSQKCLGLLVGCFKAMDPEDRC